jgi:hypothetical protein
MDEERLDEQARLQADASSNVPRYEPPPERDRGTTYFEGAAPPADVVVTIDAKLLEGKSDGE